MSCEHENFEVQAMVNRIMMPEEEPMAFTVDVQVWCKDCRRPFKFCWTVPAQPDLVPVSIKTMKLRPWLSFGEGSFGITIRPQEDDDPLQLPWLGQSETSGTS